METRPSWDKFLVPVGLSPPLFVKRKHAPPEINSCRRPRLLDIHLYTQRKCEKWKTIFYNIFKIFECWNFKQRMLITYNITGAHRESFHAKVKFGCFRAMRGWQGDKKISITIHLYPRSVTPLISSFERDFQEHAENLDHFTGMHLIFKDKDKSINSIS